MGRMEDVSLLGERNTCGRRGEVKSCQHKTQLQQATTRGVVGELTMPCKSTSAGAENWGVANEGGSESGSNELMGTICPT